MPNKVIPDFDAVVSTHFAAMLLNTSVSNLRRLKSEGTGPKWMKEGVNVYYRVGALGDYMGREIGLEDVMQLIAHGEAPRDVEAI